MPDLIPREALEYLKRKNLKPAFSYRDVWNEEHASAFTVAKAIQVDVLADIKSAVEEAIEKGETFEHFKKNLRPVLESKGWWGRKAMEDPVTGKVREAQLGSDRRLKTIYQTNLRSAYGKGLWDRGQASEVHTHIEYRIGPSRKHRDEHLRWDGLILPKDDPFWNTHFPPNGWGCKCYARFVTEKHLEALRKDGYTRPGSVLGEGPEKLPIRETRPAIRYKTWVDKRTGIVERLPEGVAPGFGWNPGLAGRAVPLLDSTLKKTRESFPAQFEELAKTLMRNRIFEARHIDFIDRAAERKIDKKYLGPVGFLDRKTLEFLEKQGIAPTSNVISLEAGLVQSPKYLRHEVKGESPDLTDWYRIIDFLLDARIYEDGTDLVFLSKKPDEYMKIVVTPDPVKGSSAHGTTFRGPTVVTMYKPQEVEVDRILKLKKVR